MKQEEVEREYSIYNNTFSNHIQLYYRNKQKMLREWEKTTTLCLIHNERFVATNSNHYLCQSCMEDYFMQND